jgi:outer membrane protein assembly factor BamB
MDRRSTTPGATLCLFAVFWLAAETSRGEDWPCWRGPRQDGVSRETGLLKTWPASGLRVLWQADLSGGYSSVAVAQGRLYTHTARNKKEEIVLCLDAATGKERWRYVYPCDYDRHVTLKEGDDSGPRATPAVDGDRVYTIGTTGVVLCLDAQSGRKVWQRDLLELGGRRCPLRGYCSSPLIRGEHLYVHPGGSRNNSIAALNKRDGSLVWQALNDNVSCSTPIWIEGAPPQILFLTAEGAVGVAPQDGKLLWRYAWKRGMSLHAATPVYQGGRVFLSSGHGGGGVLFRLGTEAGPETVWTTRAMQNQYATSVLYEGHLYGFSDTRLRCLDFATGEVLWTHVGLGKGSLLVADGCLLLLSERGDLVLAEATPKGYVEKGRCRVLDGASLSVPVLAGGRLYLRNEQRLVALDLHGSRP